MGEVIIRTLVRLGMEESILIANWLNAISIGTGGLNLVGLGGGLS